MINTQTSNTCILGTMLLNCSSSRLSKCKTIGEAAQYTFKQIEHDISMELSDPKTLNLFIPVYESMLLNVNKGPINSIDAAWACAKTLSDGHQHKNPEFISLVHEATTEWVERRQSVFLPTKPGPKRHKRVHV